MFLFSLLLISTIPMQLSCTSPQNRSGIYEMWEHVHTNISVKAHHAPDNLPLWISFPVCIVTFQGKNTINTLTHCPAHPPLPPSASNSIRILWGTPQKMLFCAQQNLIEEKSLPCKDVVNVCHFLQKVGLGEEGAWFASTDRGEKRSWLKIKEEIGWPTGKGRKASR